MTGTVPFPDRLRTACGIGGLALNVRFAEKKPAVIGAKETANVHVAPAASGVRQLFAAVGTVKRVDELAMLLMVSEEVPQLVTVTVSDEEVPATVGPKNRPPLLEPRHKPGAAAAASITAAK